MAKLHPELNAMRSDAFTLEPEKLTLITDPNHPLYDPRVHDDAEESLVRNVMVYGVIEPIIIRNNGETVEVIAGRGRVKAALEANRRLTAEGKQPIRVPAVLRRGPDADMYGVLISENECRREDNPLIKSVKAQRLIDMGKSVEEVAIAFGVQRQSVESWLALGDVAQPVLDAVKAGDISATAAAQLSGLAREEQVKTYESLKAEGGKLTAKRARQAAKKDDAAPKQPKMMSRHDIEHELQWMSEFPAEINVEFYKGVKEALRWVLGLGMCWPARQSPVPPCRRQSASDAENAGQQADDDDDDAEDVPRSYDEQHPLPSSPPRAVVGTPPRPAPGLTEEVAREWLGYMNPEILAAHAARAARDEAEAALP
jgi:ParB family chromosome partitioning protein